MPLDSALRVLGLLARDGFSGVRIRVTPAEPSRSMVCTIQVHLRRSDDRARMLEQLGSIAESADAILRADAYSAVFYAG